MKRKFSGQDMRKFFADLKNAEKKYPPKMLRSRRDMYIKQATAVLKKVRQGQMTSNLTNSDLSTYGMFTEERRRWERTSRIRNTMNPSPGKSDNKK
jgi:hypothetical protein